VVATELAPGLILDAMRAGANECVAEPLTAQSLAAAITRVLAHRASPVNGQVFAFVGAKGGVGATTVAVNVATALAQSEPGTLLIDMHPSYGDAAVLLGAEPRFSVVDALENTHRLDVSFFNGLTARGQGPTLLASSEHPPSAHIDVHRIGLLLDFAVRNFRYVVLDLPRSNPAIIDALQVCSKVFVVLTQELPSVRAASRIAGALTRRYGRDKVEMIVNRFAPSAGLGTDDIEGAVECPLRATVPNDYWAALRALNKGRPFVLDGGKLAAAVGSLTRSIAGEAAVEPAAAGPAAASLLSKIGAVRWLASLAS
jgi:pilus assembly protein CpaE